MVGAGQGDGGGIYAIGANGEIRDLHEFNHNQRPEYIELLAFEDEIFGVTPNGGENDGGVLFRIRNDGSDYQVLHHFTSSTGYRPLGGLVIYDNQVWGTTTRGGENDGGTIFSIEADVSNFNVQFNFTGNWLTRSALIVNDKTLLGTSYLGVDGGGNTYLFDPADKKIEILYEFNTASNGISPWAKLVKVNGELYGTTTSGGLFSTGNIFKIDPDNSYKVLMEFADFQSTGAVPIQGLTTDGSRLYGTAFGGRGGGGIIYKIELDGSGFEIIHHFNDTDTISTLGTSPGGTLLIKGNIAYGVMRSGGEFRRLWSWEHLLL